MPSIKALNLRSMSPKVTSRNNCDMEYTLVNCSPGDIVKASIRHSSKASGATYFSIRSICKKPGITNPREYKLCKNTPTANMGNIYGFSKPGSPSATSGEKQVTTPSTKKIIENTHSNTRYCARCLAKTPDTKAPIKCNTAQQAKVIYTIFISIQQQK